MMLLTNERQRTKQLQEENERLRKLMPDTYQEIRGREMQLQEQMSRYEYAIVDYENEKKAMIDMLGQKDQDISFIKTKYEETNTLWHQENLEKQKLE